MIARRRRAQPEPPRGQGGPRHFVGIVGVPFCTCFAPSIPVPFAGASSMPQTLNPERPVKKVSLEMRRSATTMRTRCYGDGRKRQQSNRPFLTCVQGEVA